MGDKKQPVHVVLTAAIAQLMEAFLRPSTKCNTR